MSDEQQMNSTEARTETGEIKDQSQTTESSTQASDTTQTKPESGTTSTETKSETKPEVKDETKPNGAPEKYEAFKAPEGVIFDEATITAASTLFKELGLTQEGAQKLVDFQAAQAKTQAEAPYKAYDAMREGWQNEVKADKEIGHILPKVKETIGRALDTLNDPALVTSFKEAMNLTGSGDHPAFVKAFYKLATAVVEGKHVSGSGPSEHGQTSKGQNERPNVAQAMYPNLKS